MPRMTWNIWKLLRLKSRQPSRVRSHQKMTPGSISLEVLEARALPTGNASAEIAGVAFLDGNQNGERGDNELVIRGLPVHLTGQTTQGVPVDSTVTTDANGAYRLSNVLPGTYVITAGPGEILTGNGLSISTFSVTGGQTRTQDLAIVDGIRPEFITLRMFLNTSSIDGFSNVFEDAGTGNTLANDRENNVPELANGQMDFEVGKGQAAATFDLANVFTDPDMTNSQVRFQTSVGNINVELLDTEAPQNVANFFNYVTDNRYDNTVFHRVISGFVAQGGGFRLEGNGNQIAIPKDPPVANEFDVSRSNTRGTIAMAKVGGLAISSASESGPIVTITTVQSLSLTPGDSVIIEGVGVAGYNGTFTIESVISPTQFTYQNSRTGLVVSSGGTQNNPNGTVSLPNSATNEFFFNLANNSGNLNVQNGGFTAFGRVAAADLAIMDAVGATANNAVTVSDIAVVRRDEFLTYSVIANTNDSLVTASIVNNRLTLSHAPGTTGEAVLTIRATDKLGATFQTTFPVSIADQLPVASVSLSLAAPVATATLTATATKRDADGDPVTLDYEWSVNGVVVQTTSNTNNLTDTLNLSGLTTPPQPGDIVRVRVTPNDGQDDGQTVSALTAINSAPVVNSVQFSSNTPTTNAMLTATVAATDADNDPISLTYVWKVNDVVVQTTTNTTSLSDNLDLSVIGNGDLGDQITLAVTPSDGKVAGTPVSASATVMDSAPSISSLMLTPNAPAATASLTATVSTADADGQAVTLTYVWRVNGETVRTMANTSSPTDVLDLSSLTGLNPGDPIVVEVAPNDGTLVGAVSSASTQINREPAVQSVTLTPSSPTTNFLLTANVAASDPDSDPVILTYIWKVNDVVVQTTTATASLTDTLNLSVAGNGNVGDSITVQVTPHDGKVSGMPVVSSTTVANSAPSVDLLTLTPNAPTATATVTATATTSDADGQSVVLTYVWTVHGAVVKTTTNSTSLTDVLDLSTISDLVSGDEISVAVTPNDGTTDGTELTAMTPVNTRPLIGSVELSSHSPTTNQTVMATVTASDANSDPIMLTYVWKVNGVAVRTVSNTSSLTDALDLSVVGNGDVNDEITVEVTPSDGKESGPSASSMAVVATSPPVVASLVLTPNMPTTTDMLTATVTTSDDDGLPVTVTYVWKVNGGVVQTTPNTSSPTDSLDLSAQMTPPSVGAEVSVEVTPNVGSVIGAPVTDSRTLS